MYRGEFIIECIMYPFGVVPDKPVHEFGIEGIAIKQKSFVIVEELFLDGAIESLYMSIHLGSLGIGMVVRDLEFKKLGGKVFLKL